MSFFRRDPILAVTPLTFWVSGADRLNPAVRLLSNKWSRCQGFPRLDISENLLSTVRNRLSSQCPQSMRPQNYSSCRHLANQVLSLSHHTKAHLQAFLHPIGRSPTQMILLEVLH